MSANGPRLLPNAVLAEAITNQEERVRLELEEDETTPFWMIFELNLRHVGALEGAKTAFLDLHRTTLRERKTPQEVTNTYYRAKVSVADARSLVEKDEALPFPQRCIYRVWPDFPLEPLIDRSTPTVKADAAQRAYHATGRRHHLGRHRLGHRREPPALRQRRPGLPRPARRGLPSRLHARGGRGPRCGRPRPPHGGQRPRRPLRPRLPRRRHHRGGAPGARCPRGRASWWATTTPDRRAAATTPTPGGSSSAG